MYIIIKRCIYKNENNNNNRGKYIMWLDRIGTLDGTNCCWTSRQQQLLCNCVSRTTVGTTVQTRRRPENDYRERGRKKINTSCSQVARKCTDHGSACGAYITLLLLLLCRLASCIVSFFINCILVAQILTSSRIDANRKKITHVQRHIYIYNDIYFSDLATHCRAGLRRNITIWV